MKRLLFLAFLLCGCVFAQELSTVDESKFPTTIKDNTNGNVLRASPAAAATTTAGNAVTITASPAVAGTVTAGAAAGGSVNITAGAAARKDSGNANGGDIVLTPGAGIGTGARGTVQAPGDGGVATVAIGGSSIAYYAGCIAVGSSAVANGGLGGVAIGRSATTTATRALAFGGTDAFASHASIARLSDTANISKIFIIRKDNAEAFLTQTSAAVFAGAPSVVFTNELDTTQAAIANGAGTWTVAVATNVVTVDCKTPHKFSVGQNINTDADWTANAFMQSLTDKTITSVTANTFTFLLTQANQAATTETNAGAGITPGDYVLTMPTGGTFFVDEIGVIASSATAVVTQPTIQFGNSGDRDAFYAPAITTRLTAVRTREVLTPISVYAGQTTLSAGMTTAGDGTAYKIRFYWRGIFVEDE
jgi:hypothetical protein